MGNVDRKVAANDKQRQALEMRKAGATYDDIARALGYSQPAVAHKAVKTALKFSLRDVAEDVRDIELHRLDQALLAIWPGVRSGDLKSIDRFLRIMERRARFLGLDVPTKVEQSGDMESVVRIIRGEPTPEAKP